MKLKNKSNLIQNKKTTGHRAQNVIKSQKAQRSDALFTQSRIEELKSFQLGNSTTQYDQTYNPKVLEAFDNKNPGQVSWVSFICTEFTSLCPKTGQPDFAKIFINYIADQKMVESKSLKLYLFSFRNHGDFHEDCIETICEDLFQLMNPLYIEVVGEFTPRGGIAIFPYAQRAQNKTQMGINFKSLKKQRLLDYSPGRYTMPLSRMY